MFVQSYLEENLLEIRDLYNSLYIPAEIEQFNANDTNMARRGLLF